MESRPKSIFIVEGKHDSPFISALLIDKYKIVQLHKVCLFFKNEGNKKRKYGKETEALRDLFAQSSTFSYLVKSEGGKSFVLPLLGSIIVENKVQRRLPIRTMSFELVKEVAILRAGVMPPQGNGL